GGSPTFIAGFHPASVTQTVFPGVLDQVGNPHPSARWFALSSEPLVTRARANVESVGLVGTRPSTTLRRSRQMEHTACLSHVCYHSCFLWSHFTPPIVTTHDADDIKLRAMPW